MAIWHISLREVQRRPGRTLLTVLSVAIGVAVLISVALSSSAVQGTFRELYQSLAGKAALQVVAEGGGPFDQVIAERLGRVKGVRAALPLLQRPGLIYVRHKRVQLLVLAVDPARDRAARDYVLQSGEFFPAGETIMLPASFADALQVKVGDEIKILTRRGLRSVRVGGLLRLQTSLEMRGASLVLLRLATAQRLLGNSGQVDAIDLVLDDNTEESGILEAIRNQLPAGLQVQRPAARSTVSEETLLSMQMGMNFASALSLFASGLIVLNALLMNVSERRRQIGILRAIGATRQQVTRIILREAAFFGVLGTLFGVGLGIIGAKLLTLAMATLFQVQFSVPLTVSWGVLALSLVLGPAISLLAAWIPVWHAARVSPLEAMREAITVDSHADSAPAWPARIGIALLAAFLATAILYTQGYLPLQVGTPLISIGLAGIVFLLPAAMNVTSRMMASLFYRTIGFEGDLAVRQLVRHPLRNSLTAGVLFVAIVLGVGLGNALLSNVEDVRRWYRQAISGDYVIRAMMPDMGTGLAADIPQGVLEDVRQIPGVQNVVTVRFFRAEAQGRPVIVIARSFSDARPVPLNLEAGNPDILVEQMRQGDVIIGTLLAQRTGARYGSWISVGTRDGVQRLKVAGIFNDYTMGGSVIIMDSPTAQRLFQVSGASVFIIRAAPETKQAVGVALRDLADRQGLLLQSFEELNGIFERMIAGVVAGLWTLLATGFVIASLGIANTVTMNVLEQTREIGLLRAMGMTRGQLYKLVFSQVAGIALFSMIPGAIVGIGLAYLFHSAAAPVLGHPLRFHWHPQVIVACLAAALTIVLLSAWMPALRAARLPIGEALRYE